MPTHKLQEWTEFNPEFGALPEEDVSKDPFCYMIEVYINDCIDLEMGISQAQLRNIATGVMTGIHDVFPLDAKDEGDPIYIRKILKKEGPWAMVKDVLRFDFDVTPGEHTGQRQDDI